jgi:hypothetical protein
MSKGVERQKMKSSKRHEKRRLCCTILHRVITKVYWSFL